MEHVQNQRRNVLIPPPVSVHTFPRVSAWASPGRLGPWVVAPGRGIAGEEARPFVGRRR